MSKCQSSNKMSEIDSVISCLKKNKKKSLGQNKENLTNYLAKDYGYDKVNATELIERAVEDEAVKIVQFNCKDSYRIIAKPQYLHQIHNLLN